MNDRCCRGAAGGGDVSEEERKALGAVCSDRREQQPYLNDGARNEPGKKRVGYYLTR